MVAARPRAASPFAITAAGRPAQLDVRVAGERTVRITLKPVSFAQPYPASPAVVEGASQPAIISLRTLTAPVTRRAGSLDVEVSGDPLTVVVRNIHHVVVQRLVFEPNGELSFALDGQPVLGLGEGGPRPTPGKPWRDDSVQFDRRGSFDAMEPRWQSDMYGSRNPSPVLFGTAGWGLFVASPWVQVDLRAASRGVFLPWKPTADANSPQTERNQQQNLGKGLPPAQSVVPGLFDVFVFDATDPASALRDFSRITGPAAMPPKWALGYMQSHRTLEDADQMQRIVRTFREKRIPIDAVIYLGTGFCPRGWNTPQPSFDFNPEVFTRESPASVIRAMHDQHVKVVLHMVPWDRDKLPTLHGSIPPAQDEVVDASHLQTYWQQHVPLVKAGVDGFWPDEGDWFNLFERITRHRFYYQGALSTSPNVRPWSLQRNGYPGIARWGGWVWSGDTESSWKTLEAQIAVGLNYSLSIGPYWGSDIGGFYANRELTGELFARWFQFAAFCGSFRSHGRTWWTRVPWGWSGTDQGPREFDNKNTPVPPDDPRQILQSEMNNPAIEPVVKKYAELRYALLPYTYTLAWEARDQGLPLMRPLWLHYPADPRSRGIGDEFLWGRSLLVAPVYTKAATARAVYLPAGTWYDWWTGERVEGNRTIARAVDLATMPLYARAGAIIPMDPVRQYADEPATEPTTLRIYTGADGEFTLYDDDGTSQAYLRGVGRWTRFAWSDRARTLSVSPATPAGSHATAGSRRFSVILLPGGETRQVTCADRPVTVAFGRHQ